MALQPHLREIIEILKDTDKPTKKDLEQAKFEVARKYNLDRIPGNSSIIRLLNDSERDNLLHILRRKKTRALSGVNVVAVMTEPQECPHGRCAYCPGGPDEDSPQSYTGHEPAAMRGSQNQYHPYLQVKNRMDQLKAIGHTVDKIDLIIMGGTFPASERSYQEWFVKECLDAISGQPSENLSDAKEISETSEVKNVGITVETRPDCLSYEQISDMLGLGVTRVEIGVQNVYDDIYELVDRGHKLRDVIDGTQRMKDSGLKICYHMMPGLPGSNFERDLLGFNKIFNDSRFKPDMIKIYPTLVVEGTKLFEWYKNGDYYPYSTDEAIKLVSEVKKITPPWVRIMRVQRDIPVHQIVAGVDKSNLRQLAKEHLRENGNRCNCIRCREVGHRLREGIEPDPDKIQVINQSYEASDGVEVFISAEDLENNVLIGFLRLRIPSEKTFRPEIVESTGLVRELHVYGWMTPVGGRGDHWQHRGWGETLMSESERVAKDEYDINKMVVMSALGTKEYYRRLGYSNDGVYVSKSI
ncbi:tRNA uridine(34) 5-carboxymethylaminomethyl modification radical SAM/GNAT enzyme Elp3 [Candidatus Bathyarchaeota archaeon]|nr:tRNA uridine(34) 5-carboxymethylaminomethyl modification radical SAM/GNAT enzyme Elp3 [Candidatus Bathyarchaeota archaeon]